MELLDFARGPALTFGLYALVVGTVWRLLGILLLAAKPDHSAPRKSGGFIAALKVISTRSVTAEPFRKNSLYPVVLGYLLHVGLFITVFLFVPHILFFKGLIGLDWPGLPNNVIFFVGVLTAGVGVALLIRRLTHPVLKLISNFDDYFSWFVTMAPIVTGLIIPIRFGLRYETLLAVHILSVALLFTWLPFGKLAHTFLVFFSRGTTGAVLERRGAKT
ncbi:MAG: nitrate reductase [Woeseiaceae bacterium]|nr:nitrate reductase [Woeseiaceae bacterium]